MESLGLDSEGGVIDQRVAPFIWFGNEFIDDGHMARMGPLAVAVYVIITRFRNSGSGTAWPSAQLIADLTGISRRTVIIHRQRLVDLGYIEPADGYGGREYRIKEKFRSSGSGRFSSPIAIKRTKKPKARQTQTPPPQPPGFIRFWDAWPGHRRKTDRAGAMTSWVARGCETIADTVIAAITRFANSRDWLKDDGDFIPAPKVWLNQRQWEGAKFITMTPSAPGEPEKMGEGRAMTDEDRRILWGEE